MKNDILILEFNKIGITDIDNGSYIKVTPIF